MLSLGQKLIAIVTILFIELITFVFFPILALASLVFVIPLVILILKR